MEFRLSITFAFLTLTVLVASRASHAALPAAQLYWNSVLPNTPMPKILSHLVQPDSGGPTKSFVGKANKNFVGLDVDAAADRALSLYSRERSADASNQLLDKDPTRKVFFLEKDVRPGTTMRYSLARDTSSSPFIPRNAAESVPFSSSKIPEILDHFAVKRGTPQAGAMKDTIQYCELPTFDGEQKLCATSLESMIDYATSKLGRHVQAIATEVEKGSVALQNYTIAPGVKKLQASGIDKLIACHKQRYPHAVFYCHAFGKQRAYMVSLVGADGTHVNAVTICHLDTSGWNPKNFALTEVKVKPGAEPVCHFLPEGHVAWVPYS